MVTHPASSLAQDGESSPAETSVLATMLRRLHYRPIKQRTLTESHIVVFKKYFFCIVPRAVLPVSARVASKLHHYFLPVVCCMVSFIRDKVGTGRIP